MMALGPRAHTWAALGRRGCRSPSLSVVTCHALRPREQPGGWLVLMQPPRWEPGAPGGQPPRAGWGAGSEAGSLEGYI